MKCFWLAFVLILVFLGSLGPTGTGDFFMNLTLGRMLWTQGTLPVIDPFLFTIPDYHWQVWHEWLSYAYYYKLFDAVGYGGVIVVRALWLTLFALIFWHFGRGQEKIPSIVMAPVLLLIFIVAFERCRVDRACFFGDLLVASLIMVLLYVDQIGRAGRWIWFLPVGFIFWANWHGSFPLGWFLLAAYIALRFKGWPVPERKRWLLLFALCVLGVMINPHGVYVLLWPLNVQSELPKFQQVNSEWLPFYSDEFSVGMRVRVGIFLAAGLAISAWGLRRGKYFEFLVTAAMIYSCFTCIRFVGIAAFTIGAILVHEMRSWSWPWPRQVAAGVLAPFTAIAILFYPPGFGAHLPSNILAGQWFLPNVPFEAVQFLKTLPPGNIFNEYDMGGILAWELNGRMKIAAHGHIHKATLAIDHYWRYQKTPADFRDIIGNGNVEYFIALKSDLAATPGSGWVQELSNHWLTLYSDGIAVIFKRIHNYR